MFTHRIAFACVFAACLLVSCNTKKNESADRDFPIVVLENKIVDVLPKDHFKVKQYAEIFSKNITQYFTAPSTKKTIIRAAGGLKITINPGVLETEKGLPVRGKINVSILELTNSNDLFKSNAATVSNGRLLASGGSYFIGMECNGQKLKIKKERALQVNFPVLVADKMELFYGERNDDDMNWERAGVNLKPEADAIFSITETNGIENDFPGVPVSYVNQLRLYKTLNEEVYYYNKKMTVREVVDTINRYSKKVYIDTVYTWPKELADLPKGTRVDSNYLYRVYGPPKQFFSKNF